MKTNDRMFYIDVLKALAIVMVVSLHSGLWHTDFISNQTFATYFQYFLRLIMEGVPIFLLVNGYLKLSKSFDFKKHMFKTLKLFIIYVAWSLILTILLSLINKNPMSINYLVNSLLLTDTGNSYTGILWFIRYLILIYLIFPIIKYIYDNNYKLFKYLFYILLIFVFGFNFIYMIIDLVNSIYFISILFNFKNFIGSFYLKIVDNIYLLYFMLGGIIYAEKNKFLNKRILIYGILSWIIAFVYGVLMSKINNTLYMNNYNYSQIMLMLTILGFVYISMKLNIKNKFIKEIITSISKNSMGIYLLHMIFISLINVFFPYDGYGLIIRALITIVVVMLSWLLSIIIKKIPGLNYLMNI